jgi:hypothetical protein
MKKLSLALITSIIISLPICCMEIEKISPGAKRCLEIIKQPGIIQYPEWESLLCYYGGDKEGFADSEKCAELVDNFINTTSQENCTVGLQVAVSTPNLPMPLTHKTTRSELMKKLIARQADPNPALKQLAQYITLSGPDYSQSSVVAIAEILCQAKAFDKEAIESFQSGVRLFLSLADSFEKNQPK